MDIGTAKAAAAERADIPHHLLDVVSPDLQFDAVAWAVAAHARIADAAMLGRLPIIVGGTGLYFRALVWRIGRHRPLTDGCVEPGTAWVVWTDWSHCGKLRRSHQARLRTIMKRLCLPAISYPSLFLLLFLGFPTPAAAKDASRVAKERAAKKACAMGDYDKGADILTDLFVETNDVTYVFNQARCYEQNNLWERAIARFREYLRKATNLTEAERAETDRHIADCESALGRTTPAAMPAEAPPATPARAPAAAAQVPALQAPPAPVETFTTAPATPPVANPGRGLRMAGVLCGVAGLAAIGTGVGLALKTQSISSDEQKFGPTKAQEDQRRNYETWGWVSYGVGGALLATGVVLAIVGWTRSSGEASSVALIPSVTPTGSTLLLQGGF